jgi:hypothetical protein
MPCASKMLEYTMPKAAATAIDPTKSINAPTEIAFTIEPG